MSRRVRHITPRQAPKAPAAPLELNESCTEHEDAAVLGVGYFTTLQVLFAIVFYSPVLVAFFIALAIVDVGTFFTTASLWEFIVVGIFLYLVGLITPFAGLIWAMALKFVLGGGTRKNKITSGIYPKWSRMHLRIWCIGRVESTVLRGLRVMYRSAPLTSFVLQQLGVTVGKNLQCAHDAFLSGPLDLISIGDDVAISTGAYIQATRWSGRYLHVGHVHLESGCKIGMRAAVANNVTVGAGAWITPFTPIVGDVGPHEMWEEAPARYSGHCTELKRTANACRYTSPIWLLETLNILMQTFLSFWLTVAPAAAILWFTSGLAVAGDGGLHGAYFEVTPLVEIAWHLTRYAFITAWVTIVVTSLLCCLFIRWTAATPGLYPSHGLRGALLMYRMKMMNTLQGLWTWTITGQYLRALAGVRFPWLGATECDFMINLVPEAASADVQTFWCNRCFTNMLDHGAEHFKLRRLDMPRNFFSGNNCVAEYGNLPANFLLGVSTPASDVRFRRQMRTRLSEPITVAGNPPVRFASVSFEVKNQIHELPGFPLFLARVFLNDLFSIGMLRITEGLSFAIMYACVLRAGGHPIVGAAVALLLTEINLILLSIVVKRSLVGSQWGAGHATPFWSWRHFAYFFTQDCFSVWCKRFLDFSAGTVLTNHILRWMGCRIGHRTIVTQPLQCSDWNAVNFGDDCVVDGVLQLHTFENMILKVKRTHILNGCTINFGATVMGGAVIKKDSTLLPLSMVLKGMHLPTACYEGSPAEPVSGPTAQPAIALQRGDGEDDGPEPRPGQRA